MEENRLTYIFTDIIRGRLHDETAQFYGNTNETGGGKIVDFLCQL